MDRYVFSKEFMRIYFKSDIFFITTNLYYIIWNEHSISILNSVYYV